MNIDNLTIGEAKQLAAMFGTSPAAPASAPVGSELIGQKVIVRAYRAGVLFGTLAAIDGQNVKLTSARRLWYWQVAGKKGIALEDVAKHGVSKESKITATVETAVIVDAGEIMSVTDEAAKTIENADAYRP